MGSLTTPLVAHEGGDARDDAAVQNTIDYAINLPGDEEYARLHVHNLPGDEEYARLHACDSSKETEIWDDEHVNVGTSSFWQATTNTVALLFGMGMLAIPYAVQQGGWSSLSLLLTFALMSLYTSYLLGRCMKLNPLLCTYQDIAGSAVGERGRLIFTVCLYIEILACLTGFTISIGDNLAQIFPGLGLHLSWLHLDLQPAQFLVSVAMLVISPTVLMRDLSYVSYLSLGGVVTSLIVVGAVAWTGIFGGVGFTHAVPTLRLGNWPVILGLYAYCYSGQVIIPNIYSSMKNPSTFPVMLILSFTIATIVYGGLALMGAIMFGEGTLAQITLNIPTNLTVATVVLWTTVLSPLSKFSLGIAPIATELESFVPFRSDSGVHLAFGSLIRLCILLVILCIALAFPFFGKTLAIIGSSISIAMSVIFPIFFYLILHGRTMSIGKFAANVVVIAGAFVFAVMGTWSSARAKE